MKKKIAIIHNLPPGGGLRMLSEIISRYQNKCDIDVISISPNKPNKFIHTKTIWFKVTPWKGFLPYNFWVDCVLPSIHKEISKKIDWSKYDFVFVTHDYFSKSPYILRFIGIKKIVYLCQETQREYYESQKFHAPYIKDKVANFIRLPIKYIDKKNVSYVSDIICNSIYSKFVLEKIYKKKCEVVYPGVNTDTFFPNNIPREDIILCIGGINKVKDQEFVVSSLQSILNKYKLILIGNGRKVDMSSLKKVIGGNRVEIIKGIDDKQLSNLYQKAKVTCIGAHNEPFGLTSIESQACGTPVVSVNEGGPKETIINGKTGYLSKRQEPEFLEKVKKTINKCDKMKDDCIRNVDEKWTWDITLKPLDNLFLK